MVHANMHDIYFNPNITLGIDFKKPNNSEI